MSADLGRTEPRSAVSPPDAPAGGAAAPLAPPALAPRAANEPVAPAGTSSAGLMTASTDADDAARSNPSRFEAVEALPGVLRVVGAIVAPASLLTALMFYFGLLYAVAYYRYFGVNHSVLDLSVQDLLILSVDAAIPPLTCLAGTTLLAVWLLRLPLHRLSPRGQTVVVRWVAPLLAAIGAVLVSLAVAEAYLGLTVFPVALREAQGLSLAIGVLVIAYAGRLRGTADSSRPAFRAVPDALLIAKWASLFVLVAIGLFWAVGSYAIGAGTGNAQGFTAGLTCHNEVVLYSEKSLDLRAAGVPEEVYERSKAADAFRYPSLRLVPQPGDELLLLPADWGRGGRPALLVPRTDGLRLEFLRARC